MVNFTLRVAGFAPRQLNRSVLLIETMEYIPLEKKIKIYLESKPLSLIQVGIVNQYLHRILNEIAFEMIQESDRNRYGFLELTPKRTGSADEWLLIDGVIEYVEQGSLVQQVALYAGQILLDPYVLPVLQGIVANLFWSLINSRKRSQEIEVQGQLPESTLINIDKHSKTFDDMFRKLRRSKRQFVLELSETNSAGETVSVKISVDDSR